MVDGLELVDVPKTRRSRRVIDLDGETTALLSRGVAGPVRPRLGNPVERFAFTDVSGDQSGIAGAILK